MKQITIIPEKMGENQHSIHLLGYYQGKALKVRYSKLNNEYLFDPDEVVNALGVAPDFRSFLSTDRGLDLITRWNKRHPDAPFFGSVLKPNNEIALIINNQSINIFKL